MNNEPDAINLSFSRNEELTPEKLSSFERALEHSYDLYKQGLEVHSEILGNVPNKHIKLSIGTAHATASGVLDMIEKYGDIIVLDKARVTAMLMPFLLAATELLNTEK